MFRIIAIVAMAAAAPSAFPPDEMARWQVSSTPPRPLEAYIRNTAGEEYGLVCTDTCKYMISIALTCKEGAAIPAIVNSEADAPAIGLTCGHSGAYSTLELSDMDIERLLVGGNIAFALPTASEPIHVSRFSLVGARDAIASVRTQWKQAHAGEGTSETNLMVTP